MWAAENSYGLHKTHSGLSQTEGLRSVRSGLPERACSDGDRKPARENQDSSDNGVAVTAKAVRRSTALPRFTFLPWKPSSAARPLLARSKRWLTLRKSPQADRRSSCVPRRTHSISSAMRMITTKAVAIWLGRVLGAGQMGTLYAQSIKTGPEVGQQVPAFAAQD